MSEVDRQAERAHLVWRTPVRHHWGDVTSNVGMKVNWFLPQRQTLLVLTGKVERPGKPSCSMLVDSGCEEVVVSTSYAKKLNLETKQTNPKAELWDGTLVPMTRCSNNLTIQVREASITVRRYVVDWIAYDIILGKTWPSKANPLIEWKSNRMLLKQGERLIALDAEACNHMVSQPSYMITSKQLKRLAKKEKK